MKFMHDTKWFTKIQFGTISGRSTVANLLQSVNLWSKALNTSRNNQVDVIYLDFQKAFDTVPHRRLLVKMKFAGIRGNLLEWFEQFLIGRMQRVVLHGNETPWRDVISGIPQGTISGPYCFIIYVNDILSELGASNAVGFVDDLKLFGPVAGLADSWRLQEKLNVISNWCDKWQMKLKPAKCMVLSLKKKVKYSYYVNGVALSDVESIRDLGIIISSDLRWNKQVDSVVAKANRMVGLIRKAVVSRDKDVIVPLYKALVRPVMEYAVAVWSPQYLGLIRKMEKVQRRCFKMICSTRLEDEIENSTLEERRQTIDLVNTFKIINGIMGLESSEFFQMSNNKMLRGNSKKIFKQQVRTNCRAHFLSFRVVDRWNELPSAVVESRSIDKFKSKMREERAALS